jgi:molecular chaperone GrpE
MTICRKSLNGKYFEKQWLIMFKKFKKKMGSQETEKNTQEELNKDTGNTDASNETQNPQEGQQSEQSEKDKTIQELKEQTTQLNDKYLRLYSEFDNYRRRTAKEKIESVATAGADIISILLPILDDFERAMKSAENTTDVEALKEGTNLIYQKFLGTLTRKGLEPMKTIGEPFDPELHEAITNIPAPTEDMVGKVVDELEKGYLLNGKVIRYAKVVVGN